MSAGVARVAAIALTGLEGTPVLVEAALSSQLPGMAIIGLPDAALAEAKQRVRLAIQHVGCQLSGRFVLVNLSPAAIPKHGSGFDLAIALAVIAASGQAPGQHMASMAHLGELSLDGGLRRPPGLLSAVLAARELGFSRVMVPESCGREAALVPDIEVISARDLAGAMAWHRGEAEGWRRETSEQDAPHQARPDISPGGSAALDIADVVGQAEAVEAMVVAAAGRHHISMVGPPGAGKTLLAARLPTILPDLTPEEQIVASSIASLGGSSLTELVVRPPFESPHHTASRVSLIGGGGGSSVRLGAVTRACFGILFLDESPLFSAAALDDLRQPLESGTVEIHRARVKAVLPAQVQLVLAANPCPCGNAGSPDTALSCRCTPAVRAKYMSRLSGPIADRIDLRLTVRRVSSVLPPDAFGERPTSAELRVQVTAARARAAARLAGTPWRTNGEVSGSWLRSDEARLPRSETAVLDRALELGALTMRGYDRALKVGWTLADLAGKSQPGRGEIAHALALRGGVEL